MTAKTPDSPQESRPPTAASSTASVPAQPATGSNPPVAKAAQAQSVPAAAPAPVTTQMAAVSASAPVPAAKGSAKPAAKQPAKPPAKAPTSTPRSGSNGLAFGVAVVAVLIAIGSTVVAIYALDVARQAKSRMADTTADRAAAPAPAATAVITPAPAPTTPRVQFVPEVLRSSLRIPPAEGCLSVFVDIDAMQVGVDSGHEFYLSSCLGTSSLRIDRTSGAVPTQENPTPEVCVAQLAGSSTTAELVLSVRPGLTFCLLTNKDEAIRQGIPQRVAIVEVREVGADRSVTVVISTYRVPNS